MAGGVDWVPGLVVLVVGLVAGFFLIRRVAPAAAAAPAPDARALQLRDLEARRDALVLQLREIEDGAAADHDRRPLELEAARVLRDIDRLVQAPAPARKAAAATADAAPAAARPDRAALKGFLWGTGSAAAVGLLLFLASRSASEREAGGSVTGEVPGMGAEARGAGPDAEMAQLEAAVQRNPDDVEARMALARAALSRQDMMVVYDQTRAVLEKHPGHARALSYQALVRLAMGQADVAEKMLKQAIANEPDLLEGYIHMTLVHLRQGRMDAAERDIEEAARRHPAQAPRLRALWAEMQQQAASDAAGAGPAEASGPSTAEGPADAPVAAAAGAAGGGVTGTVELSAGVAAPSGAIVFITVRPAGVTSGPPVAVKRLAASSFPLAFDIGPADSMMGQSLPDRLRVDVRVDTDGDPLTRDPADPAASADDVRRGAEGLRLVLRKGA
jgi:tetratricopeptide (TPR) repeat protein